MTNNNQSKESPASTRPATRGEFQRAVRSYRETTGDKSRNVESPMGQVRALRWYRERGGR